MIFKIGLMKFSLNTTSRVFLPFCLLFILLIVSCTNSDNRNMGIDPEETAAVTDEFLARQTDIPSQIPSLATPISQYPAAGICSDFDGRIVVVPISNANPGLRCMMATSDQMLKVVNNRQQIIQISLGNLETILEPGSTYTFPVPIGEFLALGVHPIDISPCCGLELWHHSSSETPQSRLIYTSDEGYFTFQYPEEYALYVGEKPSVDGVITPLPNSVTIQSPESPNYLLTIEHIIQVGLHSLIGFVSEAGCELDLASGQEVLIASETGLLFPDTPCGPYGSSLLFLVHEGIGYRISIESFEPYPALGDSVMSLLSTFQWISR